MGGMVIVVVLGILAVAALLAAAIVPVFVVKPAKTWCPPGVVCPPSGTQTPAPGTSSSSSSSTQAPATTSGATTSGATSTPAPGTLVEADFDADLFTGPGEFLQTDPVIRVDIGTRMSVLRIGVDDLGARYFQIRICGQPNGSLWIPETSTKTSQGPCP